MTKTAADHVRIIELDAVKNYDVLADTPGFVLVDGDSVTAAINTEKPASFIALLEFLPDKPRGNHYHGRKVEYMTVLSGRLRCEFWLPDAPQEVVEHTLESGHMVHIQPGCAHLYTALGGTVLALEYSPQAFDQNDVMTSERG